MCGLWLLRNVGSQMMKSKKYKWTCNIEWQNHGGLTELDLEAKKRC